MPTTPRPTRGGPSAPAGGAVPPRQPGLKLLLSHSSRQSSRVDGGRAGRSTGRRSGPRRAPGCADSWRTCQGALRGPHPAFRDRCAQSMARNCSDGAHGLRFGGMCWGILAVELGISCRLPHLPSFDILRTSKLNFNVIMFLCMHFVTKSGKVLSCNYPPGLRYSCTAQYITATEGTSCNSKQQACFAGQFTAVKRERTKGEKKKKNEGGCKPGGILPASALFIRCPVSAAPCLSNS